MRLLFCLISSVLSILCFFGFLYLFCNFLFENMIFHQLFEILIHVYNIVRLDLPPTYLHNPLAIFSHFHDLFQF